MKKRLGVWVLVVVLMSGCAGLRRPHSEVLGWGPRQGEYKERHARTWLQDRPYEASKNMRFKRRK